MDLGIQSHESAYIIPYKHPITQADFLEFPKENGKQADSSIKIKNISSKIQQSAFDLYDIGLNTFPLPYAKKGGLPWKTLQYTRLDRDHDDYGLFMLFSGQCNMGIMCGRTSRNLFIIDCESELILQHHINALSTRNIPLWVAKTARGGHIYLFSSDGEVDNVPSGVLQDAEIRGHNNYVLAPPSMHPSGTPYSWMYQQGDEPPTISTKQINWLTDTYENTIELSAHKTQSMRAIKTNKEAYSPLSRRTRNYIKAGHSTQEGMRNNELFCASCDMAGNQFDKEQTYTTLYPIAHASGLPREEIRATINSAYRQQRTPSKAQDSQRTQTPDWQWATSFGDHHNWSGRAKTSKRAIFGALINRAKVSSNEDGLFRASIREIASLARVGTATVQRILNEFQNSANPYIQKCGYDKTSKATLWKFPKKIIENGQELNTDTLEKAPQWLRCSVSLLHQPDAVERQALGYNGLLLYRVMVDYAQPVYPKKLSELSGLVDHQVKYALKKLAHFDLIQRVDDGWLACAYDDDALDMKIHEKRNIIGKGKRRMRQFARERAIYAGRQMFYARLRYERNAFKQAVRGVLQTRRYAKYGREHFVPLPIFREVTYTDNDHDFFRYQRLSLSDLDDDDRSLVEFGLSLGAEVIVSGTKLFEGDK